MTRACGHIALVATRLNSNARSRELKASFSLVFSGSSLAHLLVHTRTYTLSHTPIHSTHVYRLPGVRDTVVNKTWCFSLEALTKKVRRVLVLALPRSSHLTRGRATSTLWASWIHPHKGAPAGHRGNKCPTLGGGVDNSGAGAMCVRRGAGNVWEISVPSS